jgi:uncharacterized protein YidB (DUF937 family)
MTPMLHMLTRALPVILGQVTAQEADILGSFLSVVRSRHGGIAGLLQRLRQSGLSKEVDSWIREDANDRLSADRIAQAIGTGVIEKTSERSGASGDEVIKVLARLLPQVIDRLTPDGRLNDEVAENGLRMLINHLRRSARR